MNYFILILIFLLSQSFTFTQQINIKVDNLGEEKAVLYSLSGETSEFVDTLSAINEGTFQFSLAEKHSGFYRLTFNNNKRIDLIYDNEDVEILTDANNIFDSLKVIESESNEIYYQFVKLNNDYKTKTELLQIVLTNYPQADDYYQVTKEKLIQVQEEYLYFVDVTAQENPNSFVARYVRSTQLPVIDPEIPFNEQLTYLKTHALDNVNFSDDGLIYSDEFTNKTIEYLTYYRNPQLPLELLEKEFMSAVDSILNKAKVNEIVYTHITVYLLDGFKKFGFDNVLNYIVENYVIKDDLCLDQKLTSTLERRIQQSKNFKVGNSVPDIILPDSSGSEIELNKIQTDQILIIFYASWCPHCKTLLPQINDLYKNQEEKKVEVLAISIDTSKTDWLNFIRNNNLSWLNATDLEGWNGSAVSDYYLYATPTLFLIDQNKKLILNSPSIEELKNWF
ncbi:MAG: redoxin domain-containing protein [Ignavibacteriaceae bacterium]|nr:redoxin domain-containing protein [Ignavibacteriaceae bacterium]